MSETKIKARGRISLAEKYPQLLKEWDYDKNVKGPEVYSYGSSKKVWWKCEKGHEWEAIIYNRIKGSGCPYCCGNVVIEGETDLLTLFPNIALDWDYEKNGMLAPSNITAHSNHKVWWKCKQGHQWKMTVNNRTLGQGCPYCSGKRVLIGFNDLVTKNPELSAEWHPTKNGKLKPQDVTTGCGKRVWWRCKLGHEWEAMVCTRSKGINCPYCSNRYVSQGFNDLLTKNPVLANEWHPTKNAPLTPSDVVSGSGISVWWECSKNHSWKAAICDRSRGTGCPICSQAKRTSIPEQIVYYYVHSVFHDTINTYIPKWLNGKEIDIYIPEIDQAIEYDGYQYHQEIERDLEKNLLVRNNSNEIIRIREPGCPELTDKAININLDKLSDDYIYLKSAIEKLFEVINEKNNLDIQIDIDIKRDWKKIEKCFKYLDVKKSLANLRPELAKEWDYEENGKLKPENVTLGSHKKVHWLCPKCKMKWAAVVKNRVNGSGCPYCAGRIPIIGINDLATTNVQLANQWNKEKNGNLKSQDVSIGSNKKIWWKCDKGHEWNARIGDRIRGDGCPYCSGHKILSGYNDLVTKQPNLALEWDYEKNKQLNPRTISPGSNNKVWWKCKKGHSWQATICSRSKGLGCPYCSNKKVLPGYNDLATKYPSLVLEWDFEQNGDIRPENVVPGTNKKVYWTCNVCNHNWQATIASRTYGHGCPVCARKRQVVTFKRNRLMNKKQL
jgi:hypothetical protein